MNRRLHSTVPIITEQYTYSKDIRERATLLRSAEIKIRYSPQYLWFATTAQGNTVWVPEFQKNVMHMVPLEVAPHLCIIQTPTREVRRNQRHLTLPNNAAPTVNSPTNFDAEASPHQPQKVIPTVSPSSPETTRSGHLSKPPDRLNL